MLSNFIWTLLGLVIIRFEFEFLLQPSRSIWHYRRWGHTRLLFKIITNSKSRFWKQIYLFISAVRRFDSHNAENWSNRFRWVTHLCNGKAIVLLKIIKVVGHFMTNFFFQMNERLDKSRLYRKRVSISYGSIACQFFSVVCLIDNCFWILLQPSKSIGNTIGNRDTPDCCYRIWTKQMPPLADCLPFLLAFPDFFCS